MSRGKPAIGDGKEGQLRELLKAAKAAPRIDAPRLALARWLEKNGSPRRAEFIRIQCARANLRYGSPKERQLGNREQTILKMNKRRWLQPFAVFIARRMCRPVEFARGLIEIDASVDMLLSSVHALSQGTAWAWVDRLVLFAVSATQAVQLVDCGLLGELSFLALEGKDYYEDYADGLAALCGPGRLKLLRDLELLHCRMSGNGVRFLASSPLLPQLRRLDLSECGLEPADVTTLVESPGIFNLTTLGLSYNKIGDCGVRCFVAGFRQSHLETLDLSGCGLTADGVAALADWPGLGSVRTLKLGSNDIGIAGVLALAVSPHIGKLRELVMDTDLDDGEAMMAAVAAKRSIASFRRIKIVGP